MSITKTALVYQPVGSVSLASYTSPSGAAVSVDGTIVGGPGDWQQPAFVATYSFVGDGSITTIPINWIDSTKTISFTPRAVLAFGMPSLIANATNTQDATGVLQVEGSNAAPRVTAITNTSCNVIYSTAVANTSSASILLVVYK